MAFHEVLFPTNISWGSRGGPGGKVDIIEIDSGAEERIQRWNQMRRRYNAKYGVKKYSDLSALIEFYIAVGGPAVGFRYKDWLDFTTASDHRGAPSAQDEVVGAGTGFQTQYQLQKTYSNAFATRNRVLRKPVNGTVAVALDGVVQSSGWSVDPATGILTFTTPPYATAEVTAGCEFHVPVRFGKELDEVLSLTMDDFTTGGLDDIPLVEILEEGDIQEEYFYGGGRDWTLTASGSLSLQNGRAQIIRPQTPGLSVTLPDTTNLPMGGPYFYLHNAGPEDVDLKYFDGTALATMAFNAVWTLVLGPDGSDKRWYIL